ncbi:response regulator transcription factor [Christensenella sp. MSJ-20]|uniref:response regulator transcription factor n=1 Tax=Christensenella sp. MSJ-20 TaxID=2841518 RepID=UPI000D799DC7|nr:MAG: DNA-binding response regulator [Bacillota bacterium]QWT54907.1 response regulator transcription factor [Christensenella sp. MSJ-20]
MAELVYIVDDEPNILQLVSLGLDDAGFDTQTFSDGESFLAAVKKRMPDAVILDWMMPPPDGMTICRILRDDPNTRPLPILMLTAKGDEVDRIVGLELGADDYITKPFSVKELAARVKAALRRNEYLFGKAGAGKVLSHGPLIMDLDRRRVTKNGRTINLTMKEFDILAVLMENKGRVFTRDMLLDQVWGLDYYGDARTVDVHIRYLRQKIEDTPDKPRWIITLRGVGYKFNDEEDDPQ